VQLLSQVTILALLLQLHSYTAIQLILQQTTTGVMIVVFVVDTSPSMGRPAVGSTGMSRLDLAKMAVEDLSRGLRKRVQEHGRMLSEQPLTTQRSLHQAGLGMVGPDNLLLLSTSRQHPDTAACAAGGRLLVGFGSHAPAVNATDPSVAAPAAAAAPADPQDAAFQMSQQHMESFQHELKNLQVTAWDSTSQPFPVDDGGGALGLNTALSAGLQLLSRYRLQNRQTENFGMGRLPSTAILTQNANTAQQATAALQPACLVLITDGACLRQPPKLGGGSLQLQYGAQPLKEFYVEPFRWDQRIFCLGVGGRDGISSHQYLHPQLRALCEVTGGSHWMVRSPASLQQVTRALLKRISPPLPRELPLPDPLFQRTGLPCKALAVAVTVPHGSSFVAGGPVCCFQAIEPEEEGRAPVKLRAMLLYTSCAQGEASVLSSPLWCIPEGFFPSKKLDTLPPRPAQPIMFFSKYPSYHGTKFFEPGQVIKMLHRLDQLITANRKAIGQAAKCLHRDVYVCEWLAPEGGKPVPVPSPCRNVEYFPVFVPGAGRQMGEDSETYLNVGILNVPTNSSTLTCTTLTLLPPEPHILLPLLIRAAEAESRMLKKIEASSSKGASGGATAGLVQKQALSKAVVPLEEHWRSEFRAYLFRIPPYYQHSLKRALRPVLPTSCHVLLHGEGVESIPMQCFSKVCAQKIRNGEQIARDLNDRLERREAGLRRQDAVQTSDTASRAQNEPLKYGQFDVRASTDSYLAALRNMPAPWRVGGAGQRKQDERKRQHTKRDAAPVTGKSEAESPTNVMEVLGDLPTTCLMAYYESRRRWIYGGTGLTTRGLIVEGVNNDGSNSQRGRPEPDKHEECLLSLAGVGVSCLNQTTTTKMGDYRERLLFSRSPVVGSGSNDAAGVSATTAIDGSPKWSVDDDAMPMTFFDPKTGEFADSVQARVRSRLMVNFGNPYKEKRADSLIPENYLAQAPPSRQGSVTSAPGSPRTPPGSPPHDSFDSVEEGEAVFVLKSPSRVSPKREEPADDTMTPPPPAKRPRSDSTSNSYSMSDSSIVAEGKPPTPKAVAAAVPPPPKPASTSTGAPRQPPRPPPPPKARSGKAPPPPPRPPPPPPKANVPKPPVTGPSEPAPPKASQPLRSSQPLPPLQVPDPPVPSPEKEAAGALDPVPPPETRKAPPAQGALTELDLESPDSKPVVDLPPGWICVWSKSQKRWYFFDTKTNKSVWKWPP